MHADTGGFVIKTHNIAMLLLEYANQLGTLVDTGQPNPKQGWQTAANMQGYP
jgi:hypothetical protein